MATWEFDLEGSVFDEGTDRTTYARKGIGRGIVGATIPAQLADIYADPGFPTIAAQLDATNWPEMLVVGRRVDRILCLDNTVSARVTISYSNFSGGFLPTPDDNGPVIVTTNDASLISEPTFLDRTGAIISVAHQSVTKAVSVDWRRPVSAIGCFRRENTNPRSRADTFVGTVNDALWNGYAARTVLCEAIRSSSNDNGDSYDVEYSFAHRPDGWDQLVWYEDEDGKPNVSLVNGTGYKTVEIYSQTNFTGLNISL